MSNYLGTLCMKRLKPQLMIPVVSVILLDDWVIFGSDTSTLTMDRNKKEVNCTHWVNACPKQNIKNLDYR